MKYILITTLVLSWFCPSRMIQAQDTSAETYNLLIGTYTSGKSNGIYVYSFNTETGEFNYKAEVGGITNPSF